MLASHSKSICERYVLHNVLERMELGFLEVVAPVDGVEPDVQKVLCPLAVANDKAAWRQSVLVLGEDEVYAITLQVAECLDDAVGRDDGRIGHHGGLELRRGEERGVDRDRRVHDERGVVEVPEEGRAGVHGDGMAHGGHASPCQRRVVERVLVVVGEEGLVACSAVVSTMQCIPLDPGTYHVASHTPLGSA
jgi:hypothetical protein